MKAITVRHVDAFTIALGFKPTENRGKPTSYRGPIAIHSAQRMNSTFVMCDAAYRALDELGGADAIDRADPDHLAKHPVLTRGAVIAVAELTGCHLSVDGCCQPYGFETYGDGDRRAWHLTLDNPRVLTAAVPCAGKLTVPWTLPEHVAESVQAALPSSVGVGNG